VKLKTITVGLNTKLLIWLCYFLSYSVTVVKLSYNDTMYSLLEKMSIITFIPLYKLRTALGV